MTERDRHPHLRANPESVTTDPTARTPHSQIGTERRFGARDIGGMLLVGGDQIIPLCARPQLWRQAHRPLGSAADSQS